MKQLTDMRYDNVGGVREFIMKMVHIQTKLKSHQIDLNEKSIVKHALNSLPRWTSAGKQEGSQRSNSSAQEYRNTAGQTTSIDPSSTKHPAIAIA